eukprot:TRINITY_DN15522_c0_g1_i1.p1 TRINITY_DN15522_c0_g1~~TRINITY_DN15522_c0_g1_i1.p1  ORF type:complete len:101 (+),score=4.39 TRINITY_DN15522_c0_g1_i1:40-342(+)
MSGTTDEAPSGEEPLFGTVKSWNIKKGYGFLRPEKGGSDVFVHHKVINAPNFRSLLVGTKVEYTQEPVPKQIGKFRATLVAARGGGYVPGHLQSVTPSPV